MIVWERGRPARNEREARKGFGVTSENLSVVGVAGGTPAFPNNRLNYFASINVRSVLGIDASRVFLNHSITIELGN